MEEYAEKNVDFWREVCGSNAAAAWGLDLSKADDLVKFDKKYFELYPYLLLDLKRLELDDKSVTEIGLGAGTVSRYLASNATTYIGVDISDGPCEIVKRTTDKSKSKVLQFSILENKPELSETSDVTVAIGSLHHTGDLKVAISNTIGITKPGGVLYLMVYNHFAAYRWVANFNKIFRDFIFGQKDKYFYEEWDEDLRAINDANAEGQAAPYTCYSTPATLEKILKENPRVKSVSIEIRNSPSFKLFGVLIPREILMSRLAKNFIKFVGSDLYAVVKLKD